MHEACIVFGNTGPISDGDLAIKVLVYTLHTLGTERPYFTQISNGKRKLWQGSHTIKRQAYLGALCAIVMCQKKTT